ncbi:MAG: hypothetical protein JXQ72_04760 [Anaerolineae bacterium]|nr:hypothetical protein [Anaerolineae bacterium]
MPESSRTDPTEKYSIRRKGSRYNIVGPQGREFTRYQSASIVGPRWEELTHTPWPYRSSAYEPGLRLWELGVIEREQVGQTSLPPTPLPEPEPKPEPKERVKKRSRSKPAPDPAPPVKPAKPTKPVKPPVQTTRPARRTASPKPARAAQEIVLQLALPTPRIDLDEQMSLIQSLRRDPKLLFDPDVQQALRQEIEYHRPHAQWARTLLKMLVRYEKRQPTTQTSSSAILAKHIAWQEQQAARPSTGR